jgi:hypothetical protein
MGDARLIDEKGFSEERVGGEDRLF